MQNLNVMNLSLDKFGDINQKLLTTHLTINYDVLNQLSTLTTTKGTVKEQIDKIKLTVLQDPVAIIQFYQTFADGYIELDKLLQNLSSSQLKGFIKKEKEHLNSTDFDEEIEAEFNRIRFIGQKRGIVYQLLASAAKRMNSEYQIRSAVSVIDDLLPLALFGKEWIHWQKMLGREEVVALLYKQECDLTRLADRYLRNHNLFKIFDCEHSDSFNSLLLKMSADLVRCYDEGEWESKVLRKARNPLDIRFFKGYMLQDINAYELLIRRLTNYLGLAKRSEEQYSLRRIERETELEKTEREVQIVVDAKIVLDEFGVDLESPKLATRELEAEDGSLISDSEVIAIKSAHKKLVKVTKKLAQAKSKEELLLNLLSSLVESSEFENAALVVVSKNRYHALVVAARGPKIKIGEKLDLNDPLNPLRLCITKIQSFTDGFEDVLFGSKSFALSPVNINHETPVALYADCGDEGSISFESRRIFRNVVDIINEKLPTLDGGIPSEFS